MPRFVLLRHETPPSFGRPSHWDLMLESGGRLRSWALLEQPDLAPSQNVEAIGDHRPAYLDYEGPVSGDRGDVRRVDGGELQWLVDSASEVIAILRGQHVRGRLTLRLEASDAQRWRLEFELE